MPQDVLKEIFGFDSFRPGQEGVIRAVLEGREGAAARARTAMALVKERFSQEASISRLLALYAEVLR